MYRAKYLPDFLVTSLLRKLELLAAPGKAGSAVSAARKRQLKQDVLNLITVLQFNLQDPLKPDWGKVRVASHHQVKINRLYQQQFQPQLVVDLLLGLSGLVEPVLDPQVLDPQVLDSEEGQFIVLMRTLGVDFSNPLNPVWNVPMGVNPASLQTINSFYKKHMSPKTDSDVETFINRARSAVIPNLQTGFATGLKAHIASVDMSHVYLKQSLAERASSAPLQPKPGLEQLNRFIAPDSARGQTKFRYIKPTPAAGEEDEPTRIRKQGRYDFFLDFENRFAGGMFLNGRNIQDYHQWLKSCTLLPGQDPAAAEVIESWLTTPIDQDGCGCTQPQLNHIYENYMQDCSMPFSQIIGEQIREKYGIKIDGTIDGTSSLRCSQGEIPRFLSFKSMPGAADILEFEARMTGLYLVRDPEQPDEKIYLPGLVVCTGRVTSEGWFIEDINASNPVLPDLCLGKYSLPDTLDEFTETLKKVQKQEDRDAGVFGELLDAAEPLLIQIYQQGQRAEVEAVPIGGIVAVVHGAEEVAQPATAAKTDVPVLVFDDLGTILAENAALLTASVVTPVNPSLTSSVNLKSRINSADNRLKSTQMLAGIPFQDLRENFSKALQLKINAFITNAPQTLEKRIRLIASIQDDLAKLERAFVRAKAKAEGNLPAAAEGAAADPAAPANPEVIRLTGVIDRINAMRDLIADIIHSSMQDIPLDHLSHKEQYLLAYAVLKMKPQPPVQVPDAAQRQTPKEFLITHPVLAQHIVQMDRADTNIALAVLTDSKVFGKLPARKKAVVIDAVAINDFSKTPDQGGVSDDLKQKAADSLEARFILAAKVKSVVDIDPDDLTNRLLRVAKNPIALMKQKKVAENTYHSVLFGASPRLGADLPNQKYYDSQNGIGRYFTRRQWKKAARENEILNSILGPHVAVGAGAAAVDVATRSQRQDNLKFILGNNPKELNVGDLDRVKELIQVTEGNPELTAAFLQYLLSDSRYKKDTFGLAELVRGVIIKIENPQPMEAVIAAALKSADFQKFLFKSKLNLTLDQKVALAAHEPTGKIALEEILATSGIPRIFRRNLPSDLITDSHIGILARAHKANRKVTERIFTDRSTQTFGGRNFADKVGALTFQDRCEILEEMDVTSLLFSTDAVFTGVNATPDQANQIKRIKAIKAIKADDELCNHYNEYINSLLQQGYTEANNIKWERLIAAHHDSNLFQTLIQPQLQNAPAEVFMDIFRVALQIIKSLKPERKRFLEHVQIPAAITDKLTQLIAQEFDREQLQGIAGLFEPLNFENVDAWRGLIDQALQQHPVEAVADVVQATTSEPVLKNRVNVVLNPQSGKPDAPLMQRVITTIASASRANPEYSRVFSDRGENERFPYDLPPSTLDELKHLHRKIIHELGTFFFNFESGREDSSLRSFESLGNLMTRVDKVLYAHFYHQIDLFDADERFNTAKKQLKQYFSFRDEDPALMNEDSDRWKEKLAWILVNSYSVENSPLFEREKNIFFPEWRLANGTFLDNFQMLVHTLPRRFSSSNFAALNIQTLLQSAVQDEFKTYSEQITRLPDMCFSFLNLGKQKLSQGMFGPPSRSNSIAGKLRDLFQKTPDGSDFIPDNTGFETGVNQAYSELAAAIDTAIAGNLEAIAGYSADKIIEILAAQYDYSSDDAAKQDVLNRVLQVISFNNADINHAIRVNEWLAHAAMASPVFGRAKAEQSNQAWIANFLEAQDPGLVQLAMGEEPAFVAATVAHAAGISEEHGALTTSSGSGSDSEDSVDSASSESSAVITRELSQSKPPEHLLTAEKTFNPAIYQVDPLQLKHWLTQQDQKFCGQLFDALVNVDRRTEFFHKGNPDALYEVFMALTRGKQDLIYALLPEQIFKMFNTTNDKNFRELCVNDFVSNYFVQAAASPKTIDGTVRLWTEVRPSLIDSDSDLAAVFGQLKARILEESNPANRAAISEKLGEKAGQNQALLTAVDASKARPGDYEQPGIVPGIVVKVQ